MIDWTQPLEVRPPEMLDGDPLEPAEAAELAAPDHPAVIEQGGNPDVQGRYWVVIGERDPAPFYSDGRAELAPLWLRNA